MENILIVEDDLILLKKLELILASKGYSVVSAKNGLEALNSIERKIPDLIISDIDMPYLNGIELYKKIINEYKLINLPFVFFTANEDLQTIRDVLGLGADDCILKSFSKDELLKSIEIRLQKSRESKQKISDIINNINKYVPHELKTPLFPIIGWSNIIIDEFDNLSKDEIIDMMNKIVWSANRLLNRVEKFINVADLEALKDDEKQLLFESVTKINNDFINSIISEIYLVKEFNSGFNINLVESDVKINTNYLKILIKEIMENAIKFTTGNKNIDVIGVVENSYYSLIISNEGVGINKSDIGNISQYVQFDKENINQIGNGLGLALVKKITELFNGEFYLKSEKNNLTTVNIKFLIK